MPPRAFYIALYGPYIAFTALILGGFLIYRHLRELREKWKDIPSLPRNLIVGNVVNCGKLLQMDRHPDYGFEKIWTMLGQPGCFLMDMAPIADRVLLFCEPQYADAVVKPSKEFKYGLPKSSSVSVHDRLMGKESILTAEGEEWKTLRKRFGPGFQPRYLNTLTSDVLSKVSIFVSRLRDAAESQATITLGDFTRDLTTDIITQLAIETDMHSQTCPEGQGEKSPLGILTGLQIIAANEPREDQMFNPFYRFNPVRILRPKFYEFIVDRKLATIVKRQMLESSLPVEKGKAGDVTVKSIAKLGTAGLPFSEALLRNTVHQVKTFLFGGQDTTSGLLQWVFYFLSKHPDVMSKLRAEHNTVFSTDVSAATTLLSATDGSPDRLLSNIPYTVAIIKETLRLHPPAATAREVPSTNPPFTIPINGKDVDISGAKTYSIQWLIQRNPSIWGPDADVFRPERWLDEGYMATIPQGAFRPFEMGPRSCIGRDLAMLEAKIVLVMCAREFDWEKVGFTGRVGEGEEVYDIYAVTHQPVDRMKMRVKLAG